MKHKLWEQSPGHAKGKAPYIDGVCQYGTGGGRVKKNYHSEELENMLGKQDNLIPCQTLTINAKEPEDESD